MLNKKGFTVVELIVSFALTMLVSVMLFQMLISLKDMYVGSGLKGQLLSKQALISSKINGDFENKTIKLALKCGSNCLNFFFEDNTSKKLIVDIKNNLITYGEYTTKLVEGSSFDDININNETVFSVSDGMSDSIIEINVPIYHKTLKENYGINIIYQYDSRTSAISNIIFNNDPTTQDGIILIGSQEMLQKSGEAYSEPGHYTFESDGDIVLNNPNVTVTGLMGSTPGQTYTLTYTLRNASNQIVDVATRKVTIVRSVYNFDYSGMYDTFTAPFDGTYQFEAWGAQGNYGTQYPVSMAGKGGYTKGTIYLEKGTKIYIYVGSGGRNSITGGFNGGGNSGTVGSGGGGATDFRLASGLWNDTTGLRSRIMVAGAGGGAAGNTLSIPHAGGLVGSKASESGYEIYGGNGGTQTAGGAVPSNLSGTAGLTGGGFGVAGNGNSNATPANGWGSGGGSGYYGGSGGSGAGLGAWGGGGGSSFISGHSGVNAINSSGVHTNTLIHYSGYTFYNTTMIAGSASMPNPRGSGNIVGNSGDGYARITLSSFATETMESISEVEVLVVAGGGGGTGSTWGGGGGGAGGVLYKAVQTVDNITPITVTVGQGGAASVAGQDSFFGLLRAFGGGPSNGSQTASNRDGGSGGGGGHMSPSGLASASIQTSNNGGIGYGNGGGATNYVSPYPCGSGGGAGSAGSLGGVGGAGRAFNISGASVFYAGGGGQADNVGTVTAGGTGGGGTGVNGGNGANGTANTGGGGGGSRGGTGGSGGSGVVIVRYPGVQKASGGIVTYVGGYTIHTFTSSSTFVVW